MSMIHQYTTNGNCVQTRIAPGATFFKTIKIKESVGKGGGNLVQDVKAIQSAMNAIPVKLGGPTPRLEVDGKCGSFTRDAIYRYQNIRVREKVAADPSFAGKKLILDSRIDPERTTLLCLRADWEIYRPDSSYITEEWELLPKVMRSISDMRNALDQAIAYLDFTKISYLTQRITHEKARALTDAVFRLEELPNDSTRIMHLENLSLIFQRMRLEANTSSRYGLEGTGAITRNSLIYYDSPTGEGNVVSAFTFRNGGRNKGVTEPTTGLRMDRIYITQGARGSTQLELSETILHELAHYCGPYLDGGAIVDHGYNAKVLEVKHPHVFHNAEHYSLYAMCAKFGRNRKVKFEDLKLVPMK